MFMCWMLRWVSREGLEMVDNLTARDDTYMECRANPPRAQVYGR